MCNSYLGLGRNAKLNLDDDNDIRLMISAILYKLRPHLCLYSKYRATASLLNLA